MIAVSKKSRIITRSRYRRADLTRQGKCHCASSHCSGRRVACEAPFLLQPTRLPLQDMAAMEIFTTKKTPPSGRPGQVNALDGLYPQPQESLTPSCLLQAFTSEVHASLPITHH